MLQNKPNGYKMLCSNQIRGFGPKQGQASYVPFNQQLTTKIRPFFHEFKCGPPIKDCFFLGPCAPGRPCLPQLGNVLCPLRSMKNLRNPGLGLRPPAVSPVRGESRFDGNRGYTTSAKSRSILRKRNRPATKSRRLRLSEVATISHDAGLPRSAWRKPSITPAMGFSPKKVRSLAGT